MAYVILAMSNASRFHHIVYVVKLSSYNIKFCLVFSGLAMQWLPLRSEEQIWGNPSFPCKLCEALHTGPLPVKPHSTHI